MKRLFDVCVSLLLLSLFSIVICIVAILVRIKLGSPILFKQERPGMNGIPFYLYKFRTMTNEINGDGTLLPDKNRLTTFGAILRKYSLDELPQLINVLWGDLSLVGPRPLLMEYLPLYSSKQAKRHNVKPGITGWAQINGRNLITWEEKFELDVWYVENHSFLLDLKIIVITILKVFKTEGINHVGHVTMERFTGGKIEIKGEGK
ncbi:sugar transferase [Bacillus cereus]|uniref:sugar transferase n=1 Tax=Bacillus cereus TaxID=1396 RepID=UPI000BEBC963|nr:sugar transferase [Bacillus cereus]PDZ03266.1 sugar transferase [Bacillus cereus]PFE43098.1 sugar transferase [Bacillus cereus]PFN15470.1 sugar transferase [Bacillus cereus]PGY23360.1 sugar transferase [Bacillus cereus]